MKTNTMFKALAALAGIAVTPVVIGRFGGDPAGFLRAEVLAGFGVAATLVALNLLESRKSVRSQAMTRALARRFQSESSSRTPTNLVPLWREARQKAA